MIVEKSYLFKDRISLYKTEKRNISQEERNNYSVNLKFFKNFWYRLIFKPNSFKQMPNSTIANMLEEDYDRLISDIITTILAEKLKLPLDSSTLSIAVENSIKIFHEDHPYDFILEYQGERLGMMLLDICYDSNNEEKPVYRFNPNLKSFRGLF